MSDPLDGELRYDRSSWPSEIPPEFLLKEPSSNLTYWPGPFPGKCQWWVDLAILYTGPVELVVQKSTLKRMVVVLTLSHLILLKESLKPARQAAFTDMQVIYSNVAGTATTAGPVKKRMTYFAFRMVSGRTEGGSRDGDIALQFPSERDAQSFLRQCVDLAKHLKLSSLLTQFNRPENAFSPDLFSPELRTIKSSRDGSFPENVAPSTSSSSSLSASPGAVATAPSLETFAERRSSVAERFMRSGKKPATPLEEPAVDDIDMSPFRGTISLAVATHVPAISSEALLVHPPMHYIATFWVGRVLHRQLTASSSSTSVTLAFLTRRHFAVVKPSAGAAGEAASSFEYVSVAPIHVIRQILVSAKRRRMNFSPDKPAGSLRLTSYFVLSNPDPTIVDDMELKDRQLPFLVQFASTDDAKRVFAHILAFRASDGVTTDTEKFISVATGSSSIEQAVKGALADPPVTSSATGDLRAKKLMYLVPPVRPSLSAKNISLRLRVALMYLWYAPSKLTAVDRILCDFADMDNSVMERLISKYGPEPPFLLGHGDREAKAEANELVESCVDFSLVPTESAKRAVVEDVIAVTRALSRGIATRSKLQEQKQREAMGGGLLNSATPSFLTSTVLEAAGSGNGGGEGAAMTAGDLVEAYGFSVRYFDQFMALFVPTLSSKTSDKDQLGRLRLLLEQYAPNEDRFYAAIAHRVARRSGTVDDSGGNENGAAAEVDYSGGGATAPETIVRDDPRELEPQESSSSAAAAEAPFSSVAQRRMSVASEVFGVNEHSSGPGTRPLRRPLEDHLSVLSLLKREAHNPQNNAPQQTPNGVDALSHVSSVWAPLDRLSIPSLDYRSVMYEELSRSAASASPPNVSLNYSSARGVGGSGGGITLVTFDPPMFTGRRRTAASANAVSKNDNLQ